MEYFIEQIGLGNRVNWKRFFDTVEKEENDQHTIEQVDNLYQENKEQVIRYILEDKYFYRVSDSQIEEVKDSIDLILSENNCGFSQLGNIIRNNPSLLLEKFSFCYGYSIATQLLETSQFKEFKKANCYKIWIKAGSEEITDIHSTILKQIIRECFQSNDLSFLDGHLEDIINNSCEEQLRIIYEQYYKDEHVNGKIDEIINEFYNIHKRKFIELMLLKIWNNKKRNFGEKMNGNVEEYVDAVTQLVEGIMEEQRCEFTDIKKMKPGFFSQVFLIGEKILKIGAPRETYNIPNHRRILQPFIRENFDNSEGQHFMCIELEEVVIPTGPVHLDVIYEIYEELRIDGIVWGDAKFQNLGILKGKNLPKYNGEYFENNPEFTGLEGNIDSDDILQERRICNFRFRFFL